MVSRYLAETGLQPYLDVPRLRPLATGAPPASATPVRSTRGSSTLIDEDELVVASVLSGNRNFEARIHQSVKANFLMSPPLVVAFALAGRVMLDLDEGAPREGPHRVGMCTCGTYGPARRRSTALAGRGQRADAYRENYADVSTQSEGWNAIPTERGALYEWDASSTYIQEPPYFEGEPSRPAPIEDVSGARILAVFGDGISTDHISPAGAIAATSPSGRYLEEKGVAPAEVQQLRGAPRESPRHDPRDVRQSADQEPPRPRARGGMDRAPAWRETSDH